MDNQSEIDTEVAEFIKSKPDDPKFHTFCDLHGVHAVLASLKRISGDVQGQLAARKATAEGTDTEWYDSYNQWRSDALKFRQSVERWSSVAKQMITDEMEATKARNKERKQMPWKYYTVFEHSPEELNDTLNADFSDASFVLLSIVVNDGLFHAFLKRRE